MTKHVCNPKETQMFQRISWQCGCGRFFSTVEDALDQQSKYHQSVSAELRGENEEEIQQT